MHSLFLLGRVIYGGFFLRSGLNHFQNSRSLTDYASVKGVPRADAAVAVSGALLVAGGVSVIAGVKPRQGLAAIVAALVPMSVGMHRFWEADDPSVRTAETAHFMKNIALAGSALMAMQIAQPWPASVDQMRAVEDMYLHLGNRDRLRLLS
jgi:putative oxidoreductase